MAEGKKSFVAYCDWGDIFDELTDEEAGILAKHLFSYVRDEHPEPRDKLTKMIFIPIQNSLKRDLVKYSDRQSSSSDKGKLGNLKRWHPDVYEKVKSEEITLEEGVKLSLDRKSSPSDKSVANVAVSVSVSDSVNVSDSGIKKTKQKKAPRKASEVYFKDDVILEETFQEFLKHKQKKEKSKPTDFAVKLILDKLKKVSSNDEKIEMLKKAIENGWKSVFPLTNNQNGNSNYNQNSAIKRDRITDFSEAADRTEQLASEYFGATQDDKEI